MASRTPEEIRASIEENRQQLAVSLEKLRGEVVELSDWRKQLVAHQEELLIGAGVVGFVLGGGIAAVGSLIFGGRSRRRRRASAASLTNAAIASAAGSIANVADSIAASATGTD